MKTNLDIIYITSNGIRVFKLQTDGFEVEGVNKIYKSKKWAIKRADQIEKSIELSKIFDNIMFNF